MQNRIERLLGLLPDGIDAVLVASQVGRQYFTGMGTRPRAPSSR